MTPEHRRYLVEQLAKIVPPGEGQVIHRLLGDATQRRDAALAELEWLTRLADRLLLQSCELAHRLEAQVQEDREHQQKLLAWAEAELRDLDVKLAAWRTRNEDAARLLAALEDAP